MSPTKDQTVILNPRNTLTAHRVSPTLGPGLRESSLGLTTTLFPHEPTASEGLGRAYNALIAGSRKYEDCELEDYFIYTLGSGERPSVVGNSGLYRLTSCSLESQAILDTLRMNPPRHIPFLQGHSYQISDFVWGGRLSIERRSSRSRACMPFILHHLLSTACNFIHSNACAPVLLAFTQRDNNEPVRSFYRNLGFAEIGAELFFAGERQDVFALALDTEASVLKRLTKLKV